MKIDKWIAESNNAFHPEDMQSISIFHSEGSYSYQQIYYNGIYFIKGHIYDTTFDMFCLYQWYNYEQSLLDNKVSFYNPCNIILRVINSTNAVHCFVCYTWQDVFSWRTHLMNETVLNRLLSD